MALRRVDYLDRAVEDWTRLRPDLDLAAFGTLQRLIWTGRLAETLLNRAASASGMRSRGDYEALATMRRSEPRLLTPNELAEVLLSSPSGMTGKIDRLEQRGFLVRTPDSDDRRVVRLVLTDSGRAQVDRTLEISVALYSRMLDTLTSSEWETLRGVLSELLEHFEGLVLDSEPWKQTGRKAGRD